MKNKYSRFRELWAVPKYQILFKLGGYAVFFLILIILSFLGDGKITSENKNKSEKYLSYNQMKTNLIEKNLNIKYNITSTNTYYFEGTIIDNIFNGTVEDNEGIKKIKIDEENIYLISKSEEIVADNILSDINLVYLFPKNIINILNESKSTIKVTEDQKIYNYLIDNHTYSVYLEDNQISKIVFLDGLITYELQYDIIN